LKYWDLPTNGGTLKLLDQYQAKDYKNVVVILLDGMGKCIVEQNLDERAFSIAILWERSALPFHRLQ